MGLLSMLGFGSRKASAAPAAPQKQRLMVTYKALGNYRLYVVPAIHADAVFTALAPHTSNPESMRPQVPAGMDIAQAICEFRLAVIRGHGDAADRAVLRALTSATVEPEFLLTRTMDRESQQVITLTTQILKPNVYRFQLESTGDRALDAKIITKIFEGGWAVQEGTEFNLKTSPYQIDVRIDAAIPAEDVDARVAEIVELLTEGKFTVGSNVRRSPIIRR